MGKMVLSKGEKDILEKIVGYGGYVTKDILALYRHDITTDRCYRLLRQLESKGLLRQRDYFESFRKPTVFQVTRKACNYYDRPEAYMRKVHKPYAVRRYLIRAHFLFMLAGIGASTKLFSSVSREAFLREKGFTTWFLPQKCNKNTSIVQIEEYILENNFFSSGQKICFLHVDNQSSVKAQISFLMGRYRRMEERGQFFLSFIVLTESQYRAKMFSETFEKEFKKNTVCIDLNGISINYNYQSKFDI